MTESETSAPAYRVLARKYRPSDFTGMIGQEALVRILTNAISSGRIAQAFMLTGVRGVGKTTTARIIAKALNCTGPDGTGNPTPNPCGVCDNCISIAADRHVDVQELDAASRTGVDDIRELIEGVRYRPISARYKVYILDEVHMLSRNAFNALLKTLEEPPEHVKFIFATTDIRKVPVTVLSRCQRFDLRRVPLERLITHFRWILEQESREIEDEALAMVARAADGSVRDGLSILDQSIALSEGTVTAAQVRDMLGLADRSQSYDLFDGVMKGDAETTLDLVQSMYEAGADPVVIVQDLLDLCHWVTRLKLTPKLAEETGTPELERERGLALASALAMPVLSRTWQMLLKGLGEAQHAPNPIQAVEMLLIRLMHVADLPTPGDLVKRLQAEGAAAKGTGNAAASNPGSNGARATATQATGDGQGHGPSATTSQTTTQMRVVSGNGSGNGSDGIGRAVAMAETSPNDVPDTATTAIVPQEAVSSPQRTVEKSDITSFEDLLDLIEKRREGRLYKNLVHDVHLVRFEPGRIEIRPTNAAPSDLCNRLTSVLSDWLDERWVVTVSGEAGAETVASQRARAKQDLHDAAAEDPLVQTVMREFPGARINKVSPIEDAIPTVDQTSSDEGDPVFDPDEVPEEN